MSAWSESCARSACPPTTCAPLGCAAALVGARAGRSTTPRAACWRAPSHDSAVHEREAAETALANLHIEKAKVDGERKAVEADLGPVRYLATLLGSTDEQTMRWFILVVALLLDPAAVLLLLAATGHRN